MKQKAKIKNYYLQAANRAGDYVLIGEIFDHPRQTEFKKDLHSTSLLLSIDFKNKTAETLNTIYTLENE